MPADADSLYAIELFVEAGFTPVEAIKIATRHGAQYLEQLSEIGTLEEGKRADLVLAGGHPNEKISDIHRLGTGYSHLVFQNDCIAVTLPISIRGSNTHQGVSRSGCFRM